MEYSRDNIALDRQGDEKRPTDQGALRVDHLPHNISNVDVCGTKPDILVVGCDILAREMLGMRFFG
jgi:hypothetical protein